MRAALASEHRDFFRKNHFIEFEELLYRDRRETLNFGGKILSPGSCVERNASLSKVSEIGHSYQGSKDTEKNSESRTDPCITDLDLAQEHIDQLLAKRIKKIIDTRTPKELFISGRDLFREDPVISKITLNRCLAQTAALLFDVSSIRIGYDQILRTTTLNHSPFTHTSPLQEVSCLQPILGGVIIRLLPDPYPPVFLPQKVGNAVFFRPDFSLPWSSFFQTPLQSFLLITYVPKKCLYLLVPEDLHTHALKKLGYGFGDLLRNETHPVFKT